MRIFLILSLLLNLALAAVGGYLFMGGNVTASDDDRKAIVLTDGEKSFVLSEMRGLLETMQGVLLAWEEGDMKELAATARKSGMVDMRNAPKSLMLKMPMGFKTLGHGMHGGWDAIADEAEAMGDKNKIISLLSEQLGRCTACHSGYKLK